MSKGVSSLCDHKPVRLICPMADGVSSGSDQRFPAAQTDSREQAIDLEDAPESSIRKPTRIADPMLPTEVSANEHELTHLPYRSPEDVAKCWTTGKRSGTHLCRKSERNPLVNEVHIDCAFVVDIGGKESKSILVVLMRRRSFSMATAVPGKGASDGVPSEPIYRLFRRDGAVWSNKTKHQRSRTG